ncbi:MAG TPA: sigma-70 family RNA polymerase sigma factor [Polyangiales bacterium]
MSGRAMVEAGGEEADVHLAQAAITCAVTRDRLTRRLRPRVQRLVRSFLRNDADAEDASQVALLEILRAIPSFRGESKLEAWADRIAVRTAIRVARTRRLAAVRAHETLDPDELPTMTSEVARSEELPQSLRVYLDALPEARRTVLVLRHALGYSLQEIAELTGCSENTVKDRLLSARNEVRKMVRRDAAVRRSR